MRNKYHNKMLLMIPVLSMAFLLLCFSTGTAKAQIAQDQCVEYFENFHPKNDGASFFDVILNGPEFTGSYLGWCVDPYSGPPPFTGSEDCATDLFSSLFPPYNNIDQATWNKINWILNNKNGYPNTIIQPAIWYLITGDANAWTWSCGTVCKELVAAADPTFEPDCGETLAVILKGPHAGNISLRKDRDDGWQDFIIEMPNDCEEPGTGRFTGGGHQITAISEGGDAVKVTRGFTLHCDLLLSNNLEINWPGGNKFHMEEHYLTVACIDDPDFNPVPPPAPVDTIIGVATGRFNGEEGYTIEFTLVDDGEPGTTDEAAFLIYKGSYDPYNDPNPADVVLEVDQKRITGGNIQAHYDQPHK